MLALISPAKTMISNASASYIESLTSRPRFKKHTDHLVSLMLNYSVQELEEIFKISLPLAKELKVRFSNLVDKSYAPLAAVYSYDGIVYKQFKASTSFSEDDLSYLQDHLRISSLMYGVLRPLDVVRPYRMEGFVRMAGSDQRVDRFWRDIQTQTLINDTKKTGGTLLYLASKEEQNAFHWKQVCKAIKVIDFQFLQHKGDKLKQVVIYTKMARGQMIRYMLENNITDPERLKAFEWSGYRYNDLLSSGEQWVWVMD